ncbi:MAG: flavin reductase family protein [Nocardioidaceae bacterium]|nr:flavin reductase family protein [Nocardioidaceae bacterium]MCL2613854.1 flavin reductase family protein [Nocardioidaceae bacterium]
MTESGRVVLRTDDLTTASYPLLTSLVVPRPIAWVSSVSADGIGNLAPHSFFTVVSTRPPMVAFTSVGSKDTLANVEATGEFVVNLASAPLLDQVNLSSAPYDEDTDEAVALDIAMAPSALVLPPRVAASPAAIECRLHQTLPLGDSVVVIGEVVAFSVDETAMVDGHPDMSHLQPLSRLGGDEWGHPPAVFHLTRPTSV